MIEVNRHNSGLAIRGERYCVKIQPRSYPFDVGAPDATLYITVDARSSSWDGGWAMISGDRGVSARRQDVRVTQIAGTVDELHVLPAEHADLPEFRMGFTLTLEPGMREPILAALPRVERVTELTTAIGTLIESLLGRTREPYARSDLLSHEIAAIESIAAGIVLGEKSVDDAIRWSVLLPPQYTTWAFGEKGDDPRYAELGTALRRPEVQDVLAQASRDLAA
ncbi:hypothetical protein [Burkholderia cenocepacia]|uniref:hypothetical protein n=1 Tax=Burkholderia cenocepacia TaxID=95486 RepID=UPI00222FDDED|nr:hypothetical protein [Burkholderia cenocepacia]MCW3632813.1 hypothetical protein [Burkholderia cenocepacia]MCW5182406.1 hypothetical protein [Burkholderia cenocepacia]